MMPYSSVGRWPVAYGPASVPAAVILPEKLCPMCGHGWSHHVAGARCAHVFGSEADVTHVCGCDEVQKQELPPEIVTAVGGLISMFGR